MKNIIKCISGLSILLLIMCLVYVIVIGQDGVSYLLHCDVNAIIIEGTSYQYKFSLVERFPIILLVSLIFVVCLSLICVKTDRFISDIKKTGSIVKVYGVDTFRMLKVSDVKYFLLLYLVALVGLAYYYPVALDEVPTYNEFVKPSFWHALALYPYPNNHIFASLLFNVTNELSFLDLLFRLRLPSVLISLLTWIFAYRFVKKYNTENVALFTVAIGMIVASSIQYAFLARGYAFVTFFVVIGLYAAFNIIREGNRRRDWLVFTLSSALGAWTVPSYLYPYLTISIFIFLYNYKAIKLQIFYAVMLGVLVFVLYSPLLVVTGYEAIANNEFVEQIERWEVIKSLPSFMLEVLTSVFYTSTYTLILLFSLIFCYLLFKKSYKLIILWAIFIIIPVLILAIHSVLPFHRTFFYYSFIFVFLIALSFKDEINRISRKILSPFLFIVIVLGFVVFWNIKEGMMPEPFQSDRVVKNVLDDKKSCYMHNRITWMQLLNLQFEVERHNYTMLTEVGYETDIEKLPAFDYYIIEKKTNRTPPEVPVTEVEGIFSRPNCIYKQRDIMKLNK